MTLRPLLGFMVSSARNGDASGPWKFPLSSSTAAFLFISLFSDAFIPSAYRVRLRYLLLGSGEAKLAGIESSGCTFILRVMPFFALAFSSMFWNLSKRFSRSSGISTPSSFARDSSRMMALSYRDLSDLFLRI